MLIRAFDSQSFVLSSFDFGVLHLEKSFENISIGGRFLIVETASGPAPEIGEEVSEISQEDSSALQLPAILDLKAAGPLAAAFLARRGADLTIGGGEVHRLGGQCLQILLSAAASWREDQCSMRFESPSPEFISALELFGVAAGSLFQEESVA